MIYLTAPALGKNLSDLVLHSHFTDKRTQARKTYSYHTHREEGFTKSVRKTIDLRHNQSMFSGIMLFNYSIDTK